MKLLNLLIIVISLVAAVYGQSTVTGSGETAEDRSPHVSVIDIEGLRQVIRPKKRPLLVNFWATWCDPCREEFPDLVKINASYKGRLDVVTISLDEVADLGTAVPKFLTEMKATMPAYLLHTPDEDAAIALVSKNWAGNLPMTVLYDANGTVAYIRMGKIHSADLLRQIEKVVPPTVVPGD